MSLGRSMLLIWVSKERCSRTDYIYYFLLFLDVRFMYFYVDQPAFIPCFNKRSSSGSSYGWVTWCINVWHPTEIIQTCLNRTWNYSTPLAKELDIIDNLRIVSSCSIFEIFHYKECLEIKSVQPYFDGALFSSFFVNESSYIIVPLDVMRK